MNYRETLLGTILAFLFIGFLALSPAHADSGVSGIKWMSYDAARQQGNPANKKFFIYFYSERCGYCRLLEEKTFSKAEVSSYINENFVPVRVNADRENKLAAHYQVQGVPDLRFMTAGGEMIARWPGYTEADHLLALLKYIHTDSYTKMNFSEFSKSLDR